MQGEEANVVWSETACAEECRDQMEVDDHSETESFLGGRNLSSNLLLSAV